MPPLCLKSGAGSEPQSPGQPLHTHSEIYLSFSLTPQGSRGTYLTGCVWLEWFGSGGLAYPAPGGPADTHCGVLKVVKAVVCQNEPAPLPGLHPAT